MYSTMKLLCAQLLSQYILHDQSQLFRAANPHSKISLLNPSILRDQRYKSVDFILLLVSLDYQNAGLFRMSASHHSTVTKWAAVLLEFRRR